MTIPLVVWGAGGHALSLADAMLRDGLAIDAFAVEDGFMQEANVTPVLSGQGALDAWLRDVGSARFLIAIGLAGAVRQRIAGDARRLGLTPGRFIDTTAIVSPSSRIGEGTQVFQMVHIGPEVQVGEHCIINTGATVEHETVVGDYCDVAPKAVVLGRVTIGARVLVGAGSTILPQLSICADTIIGAGAVVTRSIEVPGTYVGVPAKPIASFANLRASN